MSKLTIVCLLVFVFIVPRSTHAQDNPINVAFYAGGRFAVPVPEGWSVVPKDDFELRLTNQPNPTDIPEELLPGEATVQFDQWWIASQVPSDSVDDAADFLLGRLSNGWNIQARNPFTIGSREGLEVRVLAQDYSPTQEAVSSDTAGTLYFVGADHFAGSVLVVTLMYHPENDIEALEATTWAALETALTTPPDTLLPRQAHALPSLYMEVLLPSEYASLPDGVNGVWYFSNRAGATLDEVRDFVGIQSGERILKIYPYPFQGEDVMPATSTVVQEIASDVSSTSNLRSSEGLWVSGTYQEINGNAARLIYVFDRPDWSQTPYWVVEVASPLNEYGETFKMAVLEILTRIRPIAQTQAFAVDLSLSLEFNGLTIAYPAGWVNTVRPDEPQILYLSNQDIYENEAPFSFVNAGEFTYAVIPDAAAMTGMENAQSVVETLAQQVTVNGRFNITQSTLGTQSVIIADVIAPEGFGGRIFVKQVGSSIAAIIVAYDNRFDPTYYVDAYAETLLASILPDA